MKKPDLLPSAATRHGNDCRRAAIDRLWARERAVAAARADVGLSAERSLEWLLLLGLVRDNAAGRQPDVAAMTAQLGLPRTTVRRGLERLEARGAVSLVRSPDDGRRRLVRLGPQFDALFEPLFRQALSDPADDPPPLPKALQRVLEAFGEAALMTDAPAPGRPPVVLGVNAAFSRLTGYTAAAVIGKSPAMLQGPGTEAAPRRQIRHAIDARNGQSATLTNYRKDGSAYLCQLTIAPLADETGQPGYFLGLARDLGPV
jgi:PAS domain S-box-containing protein